MGHRAYLLIDVADDTPQATFVEAVRSLEEIPGVNFIDPVVGRHDLVVMVEPPASTEALAREIRAKNWVKALEVMKIVSAVDIPRGPKEIVSKTTSRKA